MKILFGIKRLENASGGSERVLSLIASDLAIRGHEVTLVTFDKVEAKPFYKINQKIKIINLNLGISSQPTTFKEFFLRIYKLRQVILREKVDIAIGFNPSIFLLMGPALINSGIPVLGSEHIVVDHFKRKPFQLIFYKLVAMTLVKITVLSEQIKMSYPMSIRSRMVTITNPVPPLPKIKKSLKKQDRNTILNVGRLDAQKDQKTLILAFSKIANNFPNWDLKIIGEGNLRKDLDYLIKTLGLTSRVSLPGITKKIHEEFDNCDIFALSSKYESFGLVTIEAMQHKKPVLAFADCPGTNELIESKYNGLLIEPNKDKVSAFASGLTKLMNDDKLRSFLGKNAEIEVLKRFNSNTVFDKWECLLRNFLSKS